MEVAARITVVSGRRDTHRQRHAASIGDAWRGRAEYRRASHPRPRRSHASRVAVDLDLRVRHARVQRAAAGVFVVFARPVWGHHRADRLLLHGLWRGWGTDADRSGRLAQRAARRGAHDASGDPITLRGIRPRAAGHVTASLYRRPNTAAAWHRAPLPGELGTGKSSRAP